MAVSRQVFSIAAAGLTLTLMLTAAGCGGGDRMPVPPTAPTPTPTPTPPAPQPTTTANVFILPDAVKLGHWAFGDEDIVIYKGERMHWVNMDTQTHRLVADSVNATDFSGTNDLPLGGEQSFVMSKLGTTKIHCAIHPEMTGTIVVREK